MAPPTSGARAAAACPNCESPGALGAPCTERACAKQALHAIPIEHARAAWQEASSKREPLVGHFVGDFLIVSRLGKGGFGKVLLGLQRPLFKLAAAVKLLEVHGQDERTTRKVIEKFDTEAAVLAVLQHPNIVRLINFGTFEGEPYLAMEYIPGARTLQSEINHLMLGHDALDPATIKRILDQVLIGLEAAHEQHIIHRDIKPENIMLQRIVGDPWHVKILDFGLAKVVEESRETSLVMGTVQYMAPEQIEGKNLGAWTDLYAVGCIAFEFITGFRAFPGKDTQAILRAKLNAAHDPLAALGEHGLPDVAVQFIRRALARHPGERFQSAAEMRAAWARIFDLPATSVSFSRDLSHLADSEDVARLREEERRLAEERERLAVERAELAKERMQLESDRVRLGSDRLGTPSQVEYAAHGHTEQVRAPAGRTATLPPGGGAPSGPLDPRRIPWAPPPLSTEPQGDEARVERPRRSRVGLWALVALLAFGAGFGIVLATSGGKPEVLAVGTTVVAKPEPAKPEPVKPEPVKPEPVKPEPVSEVALQRYRAASDALDILALKLPAQTEPIARQKEAFARDLAVAIARGGEAGTREVEVLATRVGAMVEALEPMTVPPPAVTTANVTITSTPSGASVKVDGVDKGVTPVLFETTIGARHQVEVSATGRIREARELVVDKAASIFDVTLRPRAVAPATSPPPTRGPILPP
ncbi:MAG: protein kinase [Deltaproteobacteria bacterium]|nr:protein kinase [Deltaproteobacteria bacterium]